MSDLNGKILVFTGTLKAKRADATKMAQEAGATVASAVSGKTQILVAGEGAGSKLAEAQKKGITVMTEDEFMQKIAAAKAPAPAAPAAAKGKKAPAKKKAEEDAAPAAEEPPKKKAAKEKLAPAPAAAAPPPAPAPAPAKAEPANASSTSGRVVDREVPDRAAFKIVDDYAVLLNQTNIGGNNNKYYIIQVLEGKGSFWAWNRWGRVGEPGQNKLENCGTLAGAIKSFESKFRDKTQNNWSNRKSFVSHEGKYTIVETEEKEGAGGDSAAPMGKLSKSQIEKGQQVLEEIKFCIIQSQNKLLQDLSSRFFTLIPTNFGRARPEPIVTLDKVNEKAELLKFYLRMGFDEVPEDKDTKLTPIAGVMDLPCPSTLAAAAAAICDANSIKNSVNQGDQLAKKNAGAPVRPMNKELYGSIMLYTSNAIYRELNRVLREEKRANVQKYFQYLRLLFEATESLPKKSVTLWRGISVDLYSQYPVGKTITWWGVSSCTADVNVARNFMKGCGGNCTLLTIDTKTAVDISKITFYSNEKESLLLPGTQLLVKSSKKVGNITEIEMEEVGRLVN